MKSTQTTMDKIRVQGVEKTFTTEKGTVHVLDGVNLTVREGEFSH
ncbi:MAG: hypothetical protein R3E96_14070 [Planctomycetota bacterium]